MIIYQAMKAQFLQQAWRHDIDEIVGRHFVAATGHCVGPGEREAWRNSLVEMARVLGDDEIPADAGVAIEYQLPQTSKRIDFLIAGAGADGESTGRGRCRAAPGYRGSGYGRGLYGEGLFEREGGVGGWRLRND